MKKKAIFLDLDGTLLNDGKQITAGNRNAIEQALSQGHKVVITTGRPLSSAIQLAELLGLTAEGCYLIAFNGGMIYDMGNREILSKASVDLTLIKKVFAEANRRGIHIQTYDEKDVLVEPRCNNSNVERYCRIIKVHYRMIDSVEHLTQAPPKMLLIDYQDPTPLNEMQEWLRAEVSSELDSFFSCASYVEIMPHGIHKGWAMLELARKMGIAPEDTVAVGDTTNDYSMIQAAGVGVVMRNGTEDVKSIADYITTNDNNHDGAAEAIHRFLL